MRPLTFTGICEFRIYKSKPYVVRRTGPLTWNEDTMKVAPHPSTFGIWTMALQA